VTDHLSWRRGVVPAAERASVTPVRCRGETATCHNPAVTTAAEFFAGCPAGLAVHEAVAAAIDAIGPAEVRVTTSQIAFRRRRGFAYTWRPGRYVRSDVPAVLSFALPRAVESPRIKEVAHPAPTVWMHHVELRDPSEVDDEVRSWLTEAYADAE
jgi:hypothetical protein